jgi:subtilisin-like proprotein convertase family protein
MITSRLNLNPISSHLKAVWTIAFLLLIHTWVNSQVFNGSIVNTAGNSLIPSTGTGGCTVAPQTTGGTIFNNTVAGLGAGATLLSITVNFTHTFDSDIDMFMRAPNGQILELSTDNGAGNDNFTNTEFCDGAAINITAGAPPYTGQFRPEGTLVADVCGVTITPTVTTIAGFTAGQNGTWQLVILDDVGADAGVMISWSLNFAPVCGFVGAPGPLPALNFTGNNPAVCGIMNQNVTAPILLASCAGTATMQVFLDGVLIFNSIMSGATFQISASLGMHTLTYRLPCVPEIAQPLNVTDAVPPSIICPGIL